jgi:hypothetical protein
MPPIVNALVEHVTPTLVTSMSVRVPVPVPVVITQACAMGDVGLVTTATSYISPLGTDVAKVNGPFVPSVSRSPPSSESTTVSPGARPVSVPPTFRALVVQVTSTLVTSGSRMVPAPVPAVTTHVCSIGAMGLPTTLTL